MSATRIGRVSAFTRAQTQVLSFISRSFGSAVLTCRPSKSFDHQLFMANYRKLFKPKQTRQFRSRTISLRDRVGRATDGLAGKKGLAELEEVGVKWTLVELPPATSSDSEERVLKRKLTEMARVILK